MARKSTVTRFRLPYTEEQVYTMLHTACRVEVENRHRTFLSTELYRRHLWDIAKWLTSDSPMFGLFLCGGAGNGKTTILRAMKNMVDYLRSDEQYSSRQQERPISGYRIVNAKELVMYAKAYNNPSRDNADTVKEWRRVRDMEILAIDDLGTEPRESMHYGDFVTAATDILSYRYEEQLCTIVSSNLSAGEISQYYDERIADRFREMMHIVNFGNEQSYRSLWQAKC